MLPLKERANAGLHDFVFNYIQTQVKPNPGAAVLDIGCGSGAWLWRFQQAGFSRLMGIDLDTDQFALENIPTRALNLDEYQGEKFGQFGLITALELIEHLENPGLLFRLVEQNLADDGDFVISTPNIHALPARLRYLVKGRLNHFDNKSDKTHIYPVYLENLQRVLPRHGFYLADTQFFPAKGYGTYSGLTQQLSGLASIFLKDNLPGDNIILRIKRKLD
jgi:2-polyprenyl-3-methyl-5-hydroxy-6-metoxy-1,4-benzoquinol methylase